ncbi:MAG: hypothetical protein WBA57_00280 [Elainellaceae cyanobacterium]
MHTWAIARHLLGFALLNANLRGLVEGRSPLLWGLEWRSHSTLLGFALLNANLRGLDGGAIAIAVWIGVAIAPIV